MKVEKLILWDFRGVRKMEIEISENMTVLAGINGAGKSTVLDALAMLLSCVTAKIRQPGSPKNPLDDLDVNNQSHGCTIGVHLSHDNKLYTWSLGKKRPGHQGNAKSSLRKASVIADAVRLRITQTNEQCSIPLFAYYPVNRAVLEIPLRIKQKHAFELLNAYEDSLRSGASFKLFFEWFRHREDLENENRKYADRASKPDNWEFPDRQLEAVRKALEAFLPEFSDFSVKRNKLRMVVNKAGAELQVDQLSDGEKCLIAMIGDLARRLAIANPTLENSSQGEGIVLIDEIDLHLHPSWQRMVVPKLTEVFPNCQFVVSTHSPQVLGEIAGRDVRCLYTDPEKGLSAFVPRQALGLDSSEVLAELMETPDRNEETTQRLREVFELIDNERYAEAKDKLKELEDNLDGSIPELVRADALITMMETPLASEGPG